MKKILMTAALLAVGATAFGASAPVAVSLNVVETSQLVLMDNGQPLTQIDLVHPQILLSSAKAISTPSVVTKNFKAQTGDGSEIKLNGGTASKLKYSLIGGVDAGTGALVLTSAGGGTLNSTLKLTNSEDALTGTESEGTQNSITSTIESKELNKLTAAGTFVGNSTLKVTIE